MGTFEVLTEGGGHNPKVTTQESEPHTKVAQMWRIRIVISKNELGKRSVWEKTTTVLIAATESMLLKWQYNLSSRSWLDNLQMGPHF